MGEIVQIPGADEGSGLRVWREAARDARRGGLVLIPDDPDVTPGARELAAGFARDGYETLVLSVRRAPEGMSWTEVVQDIGAVVAALERPVFMIGDGRGAGAAWLAAARVPGVAAVSAHDGAAIAGMLDEAPACPIVLHFGAGEIEVLPEAIAAIEAAHPELPIHLYEATPDAARLARLRTLRLFALNGVGRGDF